MFLGVWHWKHPFIEPGRDNQVFPQGHRLIKLESLWDMHACVQLPDCMHVRASHGLMFPCCFLAVAEVLKWQFVSFAVALCTLYCAYYTYVSECLYSAVRFGILSPQLRCAMLHLIYHRSLWGQKAFVPSVFVPDRQTTWFSPWPPIVTWVTLDMSLSPDSTRTRRSGGHPGPTATKTRGLHWRQDLY